MPPLQHFLFHPPGLGLSVYIFNKLTRMIFVWYLFLYLNICIVSLPCTFRIHCHGRFELHPPFFHVHFRHCSIQFSQ